MTQEDKDSNIPKTAPKAKSSLSGIIIVLRVIMATTAGVSLFLSSYALVFFTVAMLPSIVSILIDKRLSKAASGTITSFNLIAVLPYIRQIHKSSDQAIKSQQLISDVYTWSYIYFLVAISFFCIVVIPKLWGNMFTDKASNKVTRLKDRQRELIDEWGNRITEQNEK